MVTAEEFLQDTVIENNNSFDIISDLKITSDVTKAMIDFANMHVKAALKIASEKATMQTRNTKNGDWMTEYKIIHKRSILNAYPESNIN